jgi:hypothetical protein
MPEILDNIARIQLSTTNFVLQHNNSRKTSVFIKKTSPNLGQVHMRLNHLMFGAYYLHHHHVWYSRTQHFAPEVFRTVIALYSAYCFIFITET